MQKNFLIKTAEFAKICNTTKETIFHYDEIGLLKPSYVSENGYRYYTLSQSDQFFAIRELKNLGLSLQEIKNKIQNESPYQYYNLLNTITDELDKKISLLKQSRQTLEEIKNGLQQYFKQKNSGTACFTADVTKSSVIKIRSAQSNQPYEYIDAYLKLIRQHPDFIENCPYIAGVMRKIENIANPFVCEQYYFRKASTKKSDFPRTIMLTAFHDSEYETISNTYQTMLCYANKNGLTLGTQCYEEILFNPLNIQENTFIIKIMIPIV